MKQLLPVFLSGKEVFPLIEGGKGISISNGLSAGAWAAEGCIGTFSAVFADSYDKKGHRIPMVFYGKTRKERHQELIAYAIQGGIQQARIAYEQASGNGRIYMNVLWEIAGVEEILEGILSKTSGMIHGIACGAGMPYKLAEIAAKFKVFYTPIVSSARAFRALWKRAYYKVSDWLGGVIYEDPWKAGGHNGLSNSEDPLIAQPSYPRVLALREIMREVGLYKTPIIMAGGVWCLREWEKWINNPELGPIAFQFGTRPLLTQESPISQEWKEVLLTLKPGDVCLNKFSPTGLYSSAVRNSFLKKLIARSKRQAPYTLYQEGENCVSFPIGMRKKSIYLTAYDHLCIKKWMEEGYTIPLRTPDSTLVFVTPEEAKTIQEDQNHCMGCLSACNFSNWSQSEGTTGRIPDPRSFCIQKTLQAIAHGAPVNNELMFGGHSIYRFSEDPLYRKGFIPTVRQLVSCILLGD